MKIHLMYHDIYNHDVNESGFLRECDLPYKVSVLSFESHVKAIYEYCHLNHIPAENIIFTFDDGGKSFYTTAAPILEKYGFRGIFFISTNFIGTKTFLSEEEILSLYHAGHIIGSHAHTHEHFYNLSEQQIEMEWKISIDILSSILKNPILYASIPNGDLSQRVLQYAAKYGIKYIYTSEPTTKVSKNNDMEVIGRYVIHSNTSLDNVMLIVSNSYVRSYLLCKRYFLRSIKLVLGNNYEKIKSRLFRNK